MFGFSKKKKTNGRNVIIPTLEGRVTNKSPGSLLARLFRDILKTTGLLNSVPVLIEKYEKNSNKDFSQIQASALSEDMTWKNFVDLILNLLEVKSFVIKIELTHKSGKVTEHKLDGSPNSNSIEEEEKEKDGTARVKYVQAKKGDKRVFIETEIAKQGGAWIKFPNSDAEEISVNGVNKFIEHLKANPEDFEFLKQQL